MKKGLILVSLFVGPVCYAQSATINWTDIHQVIDGFGVSDESRGASMPGTDLAILFGTSGSDLGLSILRVGVTDGGQDPGDCTSISTSCAGVYVQDMNAAISNGGRVIAASWSPPAAYKTNGNIACTAGSGDGALSSYYYGSYAKWLANFVESLKTEDNISLFALSVQNEPDACRSYDSAIWTAAQLDTFIASYLGPTFSSDNLTTLIMMPEVGTYHDLSSSGSTCAGDTNCTKYVSGWTFHDYELAINTGSTPPAVSAEPVPSGWPTGKYWQTEVSCISGSVTFCTANFDPSMTNALDWAAIMDQRLAVDNVNAWLYWAPITNDGEGLIDQTGGQVAARGYVMGQYSRFIRPGYYRIDAAHKPQTGVTVSAYQNTSTGTLVVVATNYTSSTVSQAFSLVNAPTFTSVTPYVTSASQHIQQQAAQSVSSNSFTYTLPADSVTTFVGTSSGSTIPAAPTSLQVAVH
jgi:glucuronoarabinoxylan endo-1,4-beta-xylanase